MGAPKKSIERKRKTKTKTKKEISRR